MRPIVPLIDLQRRLVNMGKIRLGHKEVATRKGSTETYTRPSSLRNFRLTSADKAALEHLATMYGGEVRPWAEEPGQFELFTETSEMFVRLLPGISNPTTQYEYWTAEKRQRVCDGMQCQYAQGDELVAGPCMCGDREALLATIRRPSDDPARLETQIAQAQCVLKSRARFQLEGLPSLGTWTLETNSRIAAEEFTTSVEMLLATVGAAVVKLAIEPRESKGQGGATKQYVVPVIRLDANANERVKELGGVSLTFAVARPETPQVGHTARPALGPGTVIEPEPGIVADADTGEILEPAGAAFDPFECTYEDLGLDPDPEQRAEFEQIAHDKGVSVGKILYDCKSKGWTRWGMVLSAARGWKAQ